MHRLFIACPLPEPVMDQLLTVMEGVVGARWQHEDQLHLTLRFLGKADRHQCDDVISALSMIDFPPIDIALAGVGEFDKKRSGGALWAGVSPAAALAGLHRKIDQAMIRIGFDPDPQAYLPHITVARLPRDHGPVEGWLAAHGGLSSAPFRLDTMTLYDSITGQGGSHYEPLASWRCG